ncbi:isocitrate/isopropylmalate family dehydrogenase [Labrenzia sp. CE80]|uniref:isocitrate/isopropylmalate family dehydrogenase n=1 Tax=Labrenzia sp. CE80 TaxID=1788986 RepID=UPI002570E01D|nr:isocitrate/isopropylmalate family dehydrogenase [Labrenzia sp. CE80]
MIQTALDLIRKRWDFDVLVMENMFGDILSDLAGGLVGGMGTSACAEIGDHTGLFQPAHSSAPDIMGQNKSNPMAASLSGGLMLDDLSEKLERPKLAGAAGLIKSAVYKGFEENLLRPMKFGSDMGTKEVTRQVIDLIH